MARRKPPGSRGDILQGTLDMLVLRTLLFGPAHGHTIAHGIEHSSNDVLQVEHGSLYPALYRLEHQGLLDTEWGVSDNNRRAKFYTLTAGGRKRLREETDSWNRASAAVATALKARASEG